MSIKLTIAAIIFLLTIFHNGSAQNNEIKFSRIDGPNGKPIGKIRNITQDIYGYMWLLEGYDNTWREVVNANHPVRPKNTNK